MNGFVCYIVCHYVKRKIRVINDIIRDALKCKKPLNIKQIHSKLNSIYTEINEYNEIFMNKYYLSVWLIFGSLNTFLLYMAIIQRINLIINLIPIYCFLLMFTVFSLILLNASSVNTEANNSYKIFNSLYVCYFSSKFNFSKQLSIEKFKVIYIYLIIVFNSN